MTREGLAAARRAVLALRDDAEPLPERASQAVYRTAQEALTNARKHAPGQPVTLRLGYEAAQVTVSVVNPLPPQAASEGRAHGPEHASL